MAFSIKIWRYTIVYLQTLSPYQDFPCIPDIVTEIYKYWRMYINYFVIMCSTVCELFKQIQSCLFWNAVVVCTRKAWTFKTWPVTDMLISFGKILFHCCHVYFGLVVSICQNCISLKNFASVWKDSYYILSTPD